MKTISIICQKGGVGKTTTVVNLSSIFSKKGYKTLIIDLDPQGNVSTYLNFDKKNYLCLLHKRSTHLTKNFINYYHNKAKCLVMVLLDGGIQSFDF